MYKLLFMEHDIWCL